MSAKRDWGYWARQQVILSIGPEVGGGGGTSLLGPEQEFAAIPAEVKKVVTEPSP